MAGHCAAEPLAVRCRVARHPLAPLAILAGVALLSGCSWLSGPSQQAVQHQQQQTQQALTDPARNRQRPPVNTARNLYEGSLWRGAASWGNLMRDHRARYMGDLLTINEKNKIIKVPEAKPDTKPPELPAAAGQKPASPADPILAFLKDQEKRQQEIDKEQQEILRSIDIVEVEVVRVLPNGNLSVRGVHPPIFRDRNRIKYIISLKGIVRPTDVDDNNSMPATKLSKAEYKIQRLVRRGGAAASLARAVGKPKEGALLDRLTDFVAAPTPGRAPRTAAP